MKELTPQNVKAILMDCLYKETELNEAKTAPLPGIPEPLKVKGVMRFVGLNPDRVEKHKPEIAEMLSQLPDNFMDAKVCGSFLQMCGLKNGDIWTGLHDSVDELLVLGLASGYVETPLGTVTAEMTMVIVTLPQAADTLDTILSVEQKIAACEFAKSEIEKYPFEVAGICPRLYEWLYKEGLASKKGEIKMMDTMKQWFPELLKHQPHTLEVHTPVGCWWSNTHEGNKSRMFVLEAMIMDYKNSK
jgi:hypothetical protein